MAFASKKNVLLRASLILGALVCCQSLWAATSNDFSAFFKNSMADQKQARNAYKKALAGLAFKPEKSPDQKPILLGNSTWSPSPDTFYSGTVIPPLNRLAKTAGSQAGKGSMGTQPSSMKSAGSH